MPKPIYVKWAKATARSGIIVEYFFEEEAAGVFLTKEESDEYLTMRIRDEAEEKRDDTNSFLEHTAKALAIHMVFELDEAQATELFQKIKEPLSSRVFYYLTHLRGVYSSKL